ncbi:MAG: beta-lactamase family protein [Candidatus Protochlamydia sp.]|nr:beta-lactamase family protein [Candidatus Protochlamydia sp.]
MSNGQKEPITIRQLMAHTAGLEGESHTGFRGYYRDKDAEIRETNEQISRLKDQLQVGPNKKIEQQIVNLEIALNHAEERAVKQQLPTVDEIIKGEGTNSPPAQNFMQPGAEFAYTGGGAMILQTIIETILNEKDFGKVVDARVFSKLGMKQSTFSPDEHEIVDGYIQTGNPLPGGWMQQPELAAAGLWSTPEDLAKVLHGIQGSLSHGAFLSQASAKEMVTPYFENEMHRLNAELKNLSVNLDEERIKEIQNRLKKLHENEVPGLGVFIEKTRDATYFYHSGSNLGFRCLMIQTIKVKALLL